MSFEEEAQEFFNKNNAQILGLYETEEKKNGYGTLFITFEKEKIDIYFLKYEELEDDVKSKISDKTKKHLYITRQSDNQKLLIKLERG
jgi:hypothetical protein